MTYLSSYVRDFASLAAPLTDLQKKDILWNWTEKQEEALTALKEHLPRFVLLRAPGACLGVVVETDASDVGVGSILKERLPGGDEVLLDANMSVTPKCGECTLAEYDIQTVGEPIK